MKYINYDDIIVKAGTWGKYQIMLSIIVIFSSLFNAMILIILPMMQKTPFFTYQNTQPEPSFCTNTYYSQPFSQIYDKIEITEDSYFNWAAQLKLVCNTKKIFSIVGTIFFISSICSNLTYSKFPDRYGRRKIFLWLNVLSFLSVFQLVYLVHFTQLIFVAFTCGITSITLSICSIYINETIDHKYSGLVMGLTNAMFPLGGLINTSILYYLKDWRYYLALMLIVGIIINTIAWLYLQESAKWLIANHRYEDFKRTMYAIGDINNVTMTDILNSPIRKRTSTDYRKFVYSNWDLFKYESVRYTSLKYLYLWIISGFSFFGVLLNLEGLTGNIFLDASVTYTAEFIAEIVSGIAASKIGRKKASFFSFLLATVGCLLFTYFKTGVLQYLLLFMSAIGIASGFNILYIYTPELFPTNVKSLAISLFSIFNRAAGGIIPILLTYTTNISLIIFLLSAGAVFMISTMPESLGYDSGDEINEIKSQIFDNKNYVRLLSI
jgi:MFS family permease